jgi:uncharacterized membrane protein
MRNIEARYWVMGSLWRNDGYSRLERVIVESIVPRLTMLILVFYGPHIWSAAIGRKFMHTHSYCSQSSRVMLFTSLAMLLKGLKLIEVLGQ